MVISFLGYSPERPQARQRELPIADKKPLSDSGFVTVSQSLAVSRGLPLATPEILGWTPHGLRWSLGFSRSWQIQSARRLKAVLQHGCDRLSCSNWRCPIRHRNNGEDARRYFTLNELTNNFMNR